MKFSIKFPADLVTFTEEILSGKLHFLCGVMALKKKKIKEIFKDPSALNEFTCLLKFLKLTS